MIIVLNNPLGVDMPLDNSSKAVVRGKFIIIMSIIQNFFLIWPQPNKLHSST